MCCCWTKPLANLDPVARSEVTGELIAEVADSGMTVILSTHIVAELAGVGEYLLLLAAGPASAGRLTSRNCSPAMCG